MSIRRKNKAALLSNMRIIPSQIVNAERNGRREYADRCRVVLAGSRAELERRGAAVI